MKQASDNQNTSPVLVTFFKQGGLEVTGTAVGRKGKALLIAYTISDGSPRQRWIPGKRITGVVSGEVETLPRWKGSTCKGTKFDAPVTGFVERIVCEKCGNRHSVAYSFDEETRVRSAVGFSSYVLADVLAD